jgi:hypothetical protein
MSSKFIKNSSAAGRRFERKIVRYQCTLRVFVAGAFVLIKLTQVTSVGERSVYDP